MKKIITLILGVAVLFSLHSCQQVDIDSNTEITGKPLKITAYIDGNIETRMHYEVVTGASNTITPTWENGDEIFGFDSNGDTFTFTVTRSGENEAELSVPSTYEPAAETKVYAIFAPGYSVDSLSDNSLSVNLASQGGVLNPDVNGIPFPALMCATGEVVASGENNEIELHFTNQTAIIGVKKFQLNGSTKSHTVTSMTLNGVITTGTFEVVGGNLVLTPGSTTGSITATGSWNTDASGIYEAGVYFAAMPATNAHMSLSASTASATYNHVSTVSAPSIVAGNYYYMSKKLSAEYVAQIGTDKYSTINAAWAVANASPSDVTVTLLADCAASSTLALNNSGTGAVILDLNGQMITGPSSSYTVSVRNGRSLTICDNSSTHIENQGSIVGINESHTIYTNDESTVLNLTGGTIVAPSGYEKYSICLNGASSVTISGGKLESDYRGVYVGSAATCMVNDGEIEANSQCIYNYGNTSISNGEFRSTSKETVSSIGGSANVTVTGGYFTTEDVNVELFKIYSSNSSNGKCYVTGGYFDRAVNSDRTRTSSNNPRSNVLNSNADTKDSYPFRVGNWEGGYPFVETVNSLTYWHNTLASAARQAKVVSFDVLIKMRASTTAAQSRVNLTNDDGKTITLDLNGYTLTAKDTAFIATSKQLEITDSGTTKGKITSGHSKVLRLTTAEAEVTIDGVKIECSGTGYSYYNDAAVFIDSKSCVVNIINSTISSTGSLTTISNRAGSLNITNSEISSGTTSTGLIAVANGFSNATTVINSGSFWTSSTTASRPVVYNGAGAGNNTVEAGTATIKGGYFYSNLTREVRAAYSSQNAKLHIEGGYFAHSTAWTINPTYGTGMQEIDLGSNAEDQEPHTHNTTGQTYYYRYKVAVPTTTP